MKQGDPMVRVAVDKSTAGSSLYQRAGVRRIVPTQGEPGQGTVAIEGTGRPAGATGQKRVSALEVEVKQLDSEIKLLQSRVVSANEQAQRLNNWRPRNSSPTSWHGKAG